MVPVSFLLLGTVLLGIAVHWPALRRSDPDDIAEDDCDDCEHCRYDGDGHAKKTLRTWLTENNLEELCEALEAGGVTIDDLRYLTPWDLEGMGIQSFKAQRLLQVANTVGGY